MARRVDSSFSRMTRKARSVAASSNSTSAVWLALWRRRGHGGRRAPFVESLLRARPWRRADGACGSGRRRTVGVLLGGGGGGGGDPSRRWRRRREPCPMVLETSSGMVMVRCGRGVWCAGRGVDGTVLTGWCVSSVVGSVECVVELRSMDRRGRFTDGVTMVDIWMVGILYGCRGMQEKKRADSKRQRGRRLL